MATQTLTVDGDGNNVSGWLAEGGSYASVQSDDGGTTKLYSPTLNDVRQFSLTATSGLSGAIINSVTPYVKLANIGAYSATTAIGVRTNSTDYWSGNKTTTDTTYTLFSEVWTTNPNTGLAWTVSDLDALQIGVKKTDGNGTRITYAYAVVDYTDAGGSVSVTPTTASLTTTRFAPTVSVTNNVMVTPTTASLTLTRFAPTVTVSNPQTVTPSTASLTISRFAPTVSVSNNQIVTPSTTSLTISRFAPTVTASNNITVAPSTASLTISSFAPTVTIPNNITVTPSTATLTLTLFSPTVSIVGLPGFSAYADTISIQTKDDSLRIATVSDSLRIQTVIDAIRVQTKTDTIAIRGDGDSISSSTSTDSITVKSYTDSLRVVG